MCRVQYRNKQLRQYSRARLGSPIEMELRTVWLGRDAQMEYPLPHACGIWTQYTLNPNWVIVKCTWKSNYNKAAVTILLHRRYSVSSTHRRECVWFKRHSITTQLNETLVFFPFYFPFLTMQCCNLSRANFTIRTFYCACKHTGISSLLSADVYMICRAEIVCCVLVQGGNRHDMFRDNRGRNVWLSCTALAFETI